MATRAKSRLRQLDETMTCVAFLRGINVGGCNRLPMADLTAIFRDAGCDDVRTYIQSGNVVFSASAKVAIATLPENVSALIAARFDIRSPVIIRSAAEFDFVVEGNPFLKTGADPKTLHVAFLADPPDPDRAANLDPSRSPGDSFQIRGRDIYLHLPNGVARTKLTNQYFDTKLATVSTMRNWRTVLKLRELARMNS